ncbi:MAG: FAD-dependent oxidoreductase, partial [Anaerolineaceae bacterium]
MDIAVIGAGASGIFAALGASQTHAHVTLIDHNPTVGKKLLVTGSGRCNLSNAQLSPEAYACADPDWMRQFFAGFPLAALLETLAALGIPTHHSEDGWYYPLSDSAHSVVEILQNALAIRRVELRLSTQVVDFYP